MLPKQFFCNFSGLDQTPFSGEDEQRVKTGQPELCMQMARQCIWVGAIAKVSTGMQPTARHFGEMTSRNQDWPARHLLALGFGNRLFPYLVFLRLSSIAVQVMS